jgi:hypothetical protein
MTDPPMSADLGREGESGKLEEKAVRGFGDIA